MFDTMKVARTIKEARIAQNMTQMNLADAMEVSYQAVSNWERGNSMPDIAKLEQLCTLLHISLEELLGTDRASRTITKIIHGNPAASNTGSDSSPSASLPARENAETNEPTSRIITDTIYYEHPEASDADSGSTSHASLSDCADSGKEQPSQPITMEELQDIAPLLPPDDMEKLVDDNINQNREKLNLSAIAGLAPFLDSEYLDSLVARAQVNSLSEVTALAPFLGRKTLDALVMNAHLENDMSGICSLAPFLSRETLDRLVLQNPHAGSLQELTGLAPFLSREALDALVRNADPEYDVSGMLSIAPFLSRDTLDHLTDRLLESGQCSQELIGICPFLSRDTVRKIADHLMRQSNLDSLQKVAPFLR